MLKKYTYIISSFLAVLLIMSCHNDVGEINPSTEQNSQITIPIDFEEVKGELIGYIFDSANNPIDGAKVSIYSGETTTNEFGVFTFSEANLDPQGTFIKVEKAGYLLGSDLVYPNTDGKGTARILMLEIKDEPAFQASEGGIIEIEGGGTITFPPSSLIRDSGSIYDGEVKSTAYRLSPNDSELGSKMSGGLLGLDKKGRHRVLSTFGVLAVELRSFDNQRLRIKSDKLAELTFPIDNEMQNLAEENVPSWNFNFNEGIWDEKLATTNDKQNFYTSIDALGFWNFALPDPISQLCGKLIYTNDLPAKNYVVQVLNNGLPSRIGVTDRDGFFCGKVPYGENLVFQVLHPICGDVLKEVNLGPFEEVGTIGDIIIEVEEKYISGTVECFGVENGNSTIIINSNNRTSLFFPNTNGSFSINLDEILCGPSSSFSILAYDNVTGKASDALTLTEDFSEMLRIEVCQGECLAQVELVFEKDDYCTDGDFNRVSVEVEGGSGDYAYQWQDGSLLSSFENPISGQQVCVSVKDLGTGCEYPICEDVFSHARLSVGNLYSSNTECQYNSGFVSLEVLGGKEPFVYEWSGPNGFTSNDPEIKDLDPGSYEVTVEDGGGCEFNEIIVVHDVTIQINAGLEYFCDVTVITIEENDGYKPYTYTWNAGEPISNQLFVYTPGEYRVTMTDANLCTRVKFFGITNAGSLPEIDPDYSCDGGLVTFSDVELGFDYFYQSFGSNDKIPVNIVLDDINISVLESGYRFELGSENTNFSDCSTSVNIELPKFNGLEIENINNTTCEDCTDGFIEYFKNTDEDCQNCTPGDVKVIRRENGEDVTTLNAGMQLGKGEYYVVVLDENSGCYIAHTLVILD